MAWKEKAAFLGAFGLLTASVAYAAKPADVIAKRQANFKQIGKSFKAMRDELQKDAPALDLLRGNAQTIDQAGKQIPRLFPRGTGPETGIKMEARAEIWAPGSSFGAEAASFGKLTAALRAATASGDMARIKAATGALGAGCKSCHEKFKAD